MTVGFCTSLDVDLSLKCSDKETCMLRDCDSQAVMAGILSTPCGCPQPLCLAHYERERPRWYYGDSCACYLHLPIEYMLGEFLRWEKL